MKNLSHVLLALGLVFSVHAHAQAQAPVTSVQVGGHEILANQNGMTVYTFDPDHAGPSTCYNGCASAWPPVLLPAGETVVAPFGTTVRKDGTKQVTYKNQPLYLFAGDSNPGDTNGDGDDGVWHIVQAGQ